MIRAFMVMMFVLVSSQTTLTQDIKKINFTKSLYDDNAGVIIDEMVCPLDQKTNKHSCETPLTVGEICYRALRMPEQGITWTEGIKRDDLAQAIRKSSDFSLLPADKELIQKVLARAFPSPAMIGQVAKVLDGK